MDWVYSQADFMPQPHERLLPALGIHLAIHVALFELVSWVIVLPLTGFGLLHATAVGLAAAVLAVLIERLLAPWLITSLLKPHWIGRKDDIVLWSLVDAWAEKAGFRAWRLGEVDLEAPDAFVVSSVAGRPVILLTRGLLAELTSREVGAVVTYLMGCSRSGLLSVATAQAGILSLSSRIAGGYIRSRLEGKSTGIIDILLAGWGYLLFAFTYTQHASACEQMSRFADEFCLVQIASHSSFMTALVKVSAGLGGKPKGKIRAIGASLKGLAFQDPVSAIRDFYSLRDVARKYGFDMERLMGYDLSAPREAAVLHVFERFWVHPHVGERLERAAEFGRDVLSTMILEKRGVE
ncbi:MAG: hypothetical protein JSV27_10820 [Candidatus Bathyarchaeota archaeon]|nr:MAG: hypothetical protein JSV27_10820 [Candidatus Bathyarchaeota archaeon]